jgi:hypothetical protein
MKKVIFLTVLLVASATAQAEPDTKRVCVYENHIYAVGAVKNVGKFYIQCVEKQRVMKLPAYEWAIIKNGK